MPWTTTVNKATLPNGLTLLVQRDTAAPVVSVVTHVRAGYFDEPDEWVGISHVMEHMFFKGTARRGPGEIARDTQLLGGYLNAGTIYDKTVYYTVLPSSGDGLARALDVQADALMNTALDRDELARELEVIIQEAKRKLDMPPAVTLETLYQLLFPTHRMRRWRIGTAAGLRKITAADLRRYYTTRYTPDRIIVGIVGDLDPGRAMELAAATYSGWDLSPAEVAGSPEETAAVRPDVRVLNGDVARPMINIGWRTVGTLHPDAAALDVAACLLGSGRGSRLYRGLRIPGLANSAHATHYTPTEVGVFDVSLESDGAMLDSAVTRCVELVAQMNDRPPTREELRRSRSILAVRWSRMFETMDGRAAALCQAEALGGYQLADELYDRAMAVNAAAVRRVMTQYLDPACACAVFYLPEGEATEVAQRWPLGADGSGAPLEAIAVPPGGGGKRVRKSTTHGTEYGGGVTHVSLAGIDLLVRQKQGAGLVSLSLQVPGIPRTETADNAGISNLLVRMSLRGAGNLSGEELAQAAEVLGGGITPGASADGLGWAITVRREMVEDAARLLKLVALEATLADEAVAIERKLQASDASRLRDDMFRYPLQRVLAHAYPGHPYGLPTLGEPEVVAAMAGATVREWHDLLRQRRAMAVAVGDLEPEALIDGLAPLSEWPQTSEDSTGTAEEPAFRSDTGMERRDKAQTAVALAFPAAPFGSPDRYALTVIGTLLSGLAGRLFHELRDKRSLAYTVAVMPWLRGQAGAMLGYVATSPEREDEAREAMLAELSRLAGGDIAGAELVRARNYAAGMVEIQQQSGAGVAGEISTAWTYGVLQELTEVPQRLRSVTADEVARVAAGVFDLTSRAEFVLRGSGKSG